MKRPIYTVFNIIYQIVICWVLIILNAYYNELIIPENLAQSSNSIVIKIFIAVTEGATLIAIVYVVNRAVLSDTDDIHDQKAITKRTGIVQLVVTVCFITMVALT